MEYSANLGFKLEFDDWDEFVERIDLFFEANDITEESKKRAILLTTIDAETYSVVKRVCAPIPPREVALEEIITKMKSYLKPDVSDTVLRLQFRERKQHKKETMTQYIAALRSLAKECNFADENEALLDQFLMGIRSKSIKTALFNMEKLKLAEAVKVAVAMEEANKAVNRLEANIDKGNREIDDNIDESLRKVQIRCKCREESGCQRNQRALQTFSNPCSCCGRHNHLEQQCWYKDKICCACGNRGHLLSLCNGNNKGFNSGPHNTTCSQAAFTKPASAICFGSAPVFGSSTSNSKPAGTTGTLFGGSGSTGQTGSIFGKPAKIQEPFGVFGNTNAGSAFGAAPSGNKPFTSAFNFGTSTNTSPFGASQSQQAEEKK